MKSDQIYMRVQEVAQELGVSTAHAYKVIRRLNSELEQQGYIVLQGRVDRRYFHEKMYATKAEGRDGSYAGV